ncbi:MAG: YfhO family protein [Chloroflexota bacterium]
MEATFVRRPWLLPLILALLTLIVLRPVVLRPEPGQVLDGSDFRDMFYPLHEYIAQTLYSGELPLWNPHQFLGHPISGNPHAALFYPATWFMWIVGVRRGMNLMLALHTWWAAWGMARLARSFDSSHIGSLLAGVIYAMSGWVGARYYAGHYNLLIVFAWIPWVMTAYRYALARKTWRSTLPGMAALGLTLLAGHPPLTVYLGLSLVTLWLYNAARSRYRLRALWDGGRLLAITIIGAVVLGAALVLPAAELTTRSARTTTDETFNNSYALPPAQYLSLLIPDLFGRPKTPTAYWGAQNYEELTAYAGLLPLLAIPLAFRWKKDDSAYWIGLVALALILSVGLDGGLMALLWRWVPGFSFFRVPARALFFLLLAVAGLTAQLVTHLQTSNVDERREALRPALRVWLPALGAILFVGAVYFGGSVANSSIINGNSPQREFVVAGALTSAAVIVLGVWVVLWLWTSPKTETVQWALLFTCLLVTLDAWHVVIPLITVSTITNSPIWTDAKTIVPPGPDSRLDLLLTVNIASVNGLYNVLGYDPLPIEAYRKLREVADAHIAFDRLDMLLGVNYLVEDTDKPISASNIEPIGHSDNALFYHRKDVFPRAWFAAGVTVEPNDKLVQQSVILGDKDLHNVFVDRPLTCPIASGSANITEYRPNDVTIKTNGGGGVLILSDQYYPGWNATIDGKPVDIYRADTVFRAVCVPAGDHTVRYEFRPLSLFMGIVVSAVGWVVLCAVALFVRRRPRQSPPVGFETQPLDIYD